MYIDCLKDRYKDDLGTSVTFFCMYLSPTNYLLIIIETYKLTILNVLRNFLGVKMVLKYI